MSLSERTSWTTDKTAMNSAVHSEDTARKRRRLPHGQHFCFRGRIAGTKKHGSGQERTGRNGMSLQFIIGGSGSGKTRRLYEDLIRQSMEEPESRFFAIVPEQFTMQTQKEIVALHPRHGVMNIDIVSFERLAYRIFEELAVERLAVLDDMGKSMVLRRVAAQVRPELRLFGGHLDKSGFIGELKSMLSEFFQYGITGDRLLELSDQVSSPLLRQKLLDMSVLYGAFQSYTEHRVIVKEEILGLLCRVLPQSKLIRGSVVALDGFTGFTPIQYQLLELLLSVCRKVTVAITMDSEDNPYREGEVQQLFHMSRHTVCRLIDLAGRAGTGREPDIFLKERPFWRFQKSPELQFIEQELFRYRRNGKVYRREGRNESVFLVQAASPLAESQFICGEMLRLVKEKGMRYRDMAVITGDMATYARELSRQFAENGIPCFIDDKKNIMGNPLVELLRAALEVMQSNFSYESVFRYLKTGLVLPLSSCPGIPTERQQELLCEAENYVIALGIRGYGKWSEPWTRVYRGRELLNLEELNTFRHAVMIPLEGLREVFSRRKATIREMVEALVTFLETLEAEKKLEELKEQFRNQGDVSLEKEYSQVYGLVMELFDRITALLGEEKMGRREFAEILDAGFSEIKVGLIPAVVDRVVVGDITRTRLSGIQVLFFAGVNDGIVPAVSARGGILSEAERRNLKEQEVELAPTVREESFQQRFYLYLALTRPSSRLYVSCASSSSDGKQLRPSSLITQLLRLFPEKRLEVPEERKLARWSPSMGLSWVLDEMKSCGNREEDPEFSSLYRFFCQSGAFGEEMRRLSEAAFYSYQDWGIGKAAARELYSPILRGSVTRMELYASCAYAHFLTYGLGLSERQVYEIQAADIGNLFHGAIDTYFRRMKEEHRSFCGISEEERRQLVKECVASVTADYGNTILKSSYRNQYLERKVERITDRTVWALTEQLRKGDFEPSGFEVSFSSADHLRAMQIPLSRDEAIHLRGRIDRIDLCEDGDILYLKIIDYKTGKTKFDLTDIYYGLQLQLVVYMDAALEKTGREYPDKTIVPSGLFYYHIDDPMAERKPGNGEEETKSQILRQLRMNGLVNGKPESLCHLDHRLGEESGAVDSDVAPVVMKDSQIVERRSSAAGEERFRVLGSFVNRKLKAMGREILDGTISVAPYKNGNRTACDYCPYHSICGFDVKTEGYGYRRFDSLNPEEVWEKMEQSAEAAGQKAEMEERREEGYHGGKLDQGTGAGH